MQSALLKTVILTAFALVAFAANSVLARMALSSGGIDVLGFTGLRMASGAAVLSAAARWTARAEPRTIIGAGGWWQAGSLLLYAITASLSYALLGAGVGALILFGAVQIATVGRAIVPGERPAPFVWIGLVLAFGALAFLVSPSIAPPDPVGVVLSIASGIGWAAYSLAGHGSDSPLLDTSGNFLRIAPISMVLGVVGCLFHPSTINASLLAVLCGAVSTSEARAGSNRATRRPGARRSVRDPARRRTSDRALRTLGDCHARQSRDGDHGPPNDSSSGHLMERRDVCAHR